jgi:hypothetical protein
MPTGQLLVRLSDGARNRFEREALVSLFDGAQRRVHAAFHQKPNIEFTIPITDGPNDMYRVVVSARDHLDAGQMAIPVKADTVSIVDLMMIPKRSRPMFRPLADLDAIHPRLRPLIEGFLQETLGSSGDASYQQLQNSNPAGLITLLSISSAFADFAAPDHPLDFVDRLLELQQDRFFAQARGAMQSFLEQRSPVFTNALSLLHPGAFASFKESRYAEGNVQFTFSKIPDSTTNELKLDSDIDLFADQASHFVLEVLPNDVFNPPSKTDPRRAYAMRWMSVERKRIVDPTIAKFDPPFTLVMT